MTTRRGGGTGILRAGLPRHQAVQQSGGLVADPLRGDRDAREPGLAQLALQFVVAKSEQGHVVGHRQAHLCRQVRQIPGGSIVAAEDGCRLGQPVEPAFVAGFLPQSGGGEIGKKLAIARDLVAGPGHPPPEGRLLRPGVSGRGAAKAEMSAPVEEVLRGEASGGRVVDVDGRVSEPGRAEAVSTSGVPIRRSSFAMRGRTRPAMIPCGSQSRPRGPPVAVAAGNRGGSSWGVWPRRHARPAAPPEQSSIPGPAAGRSGEAESWQDSSVAGHAQKW